MLKRDCRVLTVLAVGNGNAGKSLCIPGCRDLYDSQAGTPVLLLDNLLLYAEFFGGFTEAFKRACQCAVVDAIGDAEMPRAAEADTGHGEHHFFL